MSHNADLTSPGAFKRSYTSLETVVRLLAYGKNLGIPVDGLLEFYGVDLRRDTHKPGYVPGHILEMMILIGAEWRQRAGDPLAGLEAALGLGNSFAGLWGFIAEKSDTLGKAIEVAGLYQKLHASTLDAERRHSPGYLDIVVTPRFKSPAASAHAVDFYLIQLDKFVKHCTGEALGVTDCVHFQHAAPETPELLARYQAEFNCPIHFGATENLLRLPTAALSLPLVTADALLRNTLEQHARDQLAAYHQKKEDFADSARRHLRTLIAGGHVSKEALAECLDMNPRTLLRKLQAAGTTYRELCHEVRLDLARHYLKQPMAPLAMIASQIGFQDPQSFSRWFTDQTDESPSAFRNRQAALPGEEAGAGRKDS